MNSLDKLIDFIIAGLIGLFVGSLRYLSSHSKYTLTEYISTVAGSLLGGYTMYYLVKAFNYSSDWTIAIAFIGAGAGTKIMDIVIEILIGKLNKYREDQKQSNLSEEVEDLSEDINQDES